MGQVPATTLAVHHNLGPPRAPVASTARQCPRAHGGKRESICSGKRTLVRIDRTINEEEVDLSEHEHYTTVFQPGLMLAEIGPPSITSQGGSSLAKFESQWLTLSLEECSS